MLKREKFRRYVDLDAVRDYLALLRREALPGPLTPRACRPCAPPTPTTTT